MNQVGFRSLALRARFAISISAVAAWLGSRPVSRLSARLAPSGLGLRPRPSPRRLFSNSNSKSWVVLGVATAMALGACGGDEPVTDPQPISAESPFRYPIDEWDAGAEGQVVVMVHVTEVGAVDSAYVLTGSGRPALDSAALAGARALEFAPGRRGDERIAMWAKLPVDFTKPDSMRSGGTE